jgi:hypothetical protein
VLGSSKATNVACLAVFDPDTNIALSRQLEIELFVYKTDFACEWSKWLVRVNMYGWYTGLRTLELYILQL